MKSSYIIYKPYMMLSQFTKEMPHHITLQDLDYTFPKDVYPIGRLDQDSEGLLLLSNDKSLNASILDPQNKTAKTYWVQVEGNPTVAALEPLSKGIEINIKGKTYTTLPAQCGLLNTADINNIIPKRNPPIRTRINIPDSWVSITIVEGKNRQVRKMFAAIGFPVLRLIRSSILHFNIGENALKNIQPGTVIPIRL